MPTYLVGDYLSERIAGILRAENRFFLQEEETEKSTAGKKVKIIHLNEQAHCYLRRLILSLWPHILSEVFCAPGFAH